MIPFQNEIRMFVGNALTKKTQETGEINWTLYNKLLLVGFDETR